MPLVRSSVGDDVNKKPVANKSVNVGLGRPVGGTRRRQCPRAKSAHTGDSQNAGDPNSLAFKAPLHACVFWVATGTAFLCMAIGRLTLAAAPSPFPCHCEPRPLNPPSWLRHPELHGAITIDGDLAPAINTPLLDILQVLALAARGQCINTFPDERAHTARLDRLDSP